LEKAAAFDHPEAVFRLAKHVEVGDGVPSSAVKAAELYERAAHLNHPLAGRELALLRGY
jgi:TPR repeat protein